MVNDFKTELQAIVEQFLPDQGQQYIERVQQAGVSSYDEMLAVLQDQTVDTDTRTTVCWILARLGDKQAVPALLAVLGDKNPDLRSAAARSLGELDAKEAVVHLDPISPIIRLALKVHYSQNQNSLLFDLVNNTVRKPDCSTASCVC